MDTNEQLIALPPSSFFRFIALSFFRRYFSPFREKKTTAHDKTRYERTTTRADWAERRISGAQDQGLASHGTRIRIAKGIGRAEGW